MKPQLLRWLAIQSLKLEASVDLAVLVRCFELMTSHTNLSALKVALSSGVTPEQLAEERPIAIALSAGATEEEVRVLLNPED